MRKTLSVEARRPPTFNFGVCVVLMNVMSAGAGKCETGLESESMNKDELDSGGMYKKDADRPDYS